MAEHRSSRVAGATECAGSDGLETVEKLKSGTRSEQSYCRGNHLFVRACTGGRSNEETDKDYAAAGHEDRAESNRSAAGVSRGDGIFAAQRLADAYRGRGRYPQRDHKGQRDGIQRNLVAGERYGT